MAARLRRARSARRRADQRAHDPQERQEDPEHEEPGMALAQRGHAEHDKCQQVQRSEDDPQERRHRVAPFQSVIESADRPPPRAARHPLEGMNSRAAGSSRMGDADDPAACWSRLMSTATVSHNGPASDVVGAGRKRVQARRVEHPTSAQRSARGKAARAQVPRSSQGRWEPAAGRRDPVDVLEEQAQTRVPDLVPIRYGRMLVSPFTFYRGAAALMAGDLAGSPRTGLHVQLCGDAHLSNFGAFAAPDRRLTFGVNDFDESLPGPFEWDVKRLAASFAVAGRDRGLDAKERETVNVAVGLSYREAMRDFAQMRALDLWYARIDVENLAKQWATRATAKQRKRLDRNVAKARSKDSMRAFDRLTQHVDGHPRIISDSPLIVPIEELVSPEHRAELEHTLRGVIRSYRRTLTADRRRLLERFQYV